MKSVKSIIACLFFIQISLFIHAQRWGLKGGLSVSTLQNNEDFFDVKPRVGFHFGPTLEFALSDRLGIETGLILTQRGYKLAYSDSFTYLFFTYNTSSEQKLTLYYIDLPVTPKFYIDAGNARFFGQLGPLASLGFYGRYKSQFTTNGAQQSSDGEVEWLTFKDRIHFGLLAAAGVEIDQFAFSLNYNYAVNTEFKSEGNFRYVNASVAYHF